LHLTARKITEDCLVNKDKIDPCRLENLQCVCKYSNSIADNKYFNQNCLYATCHTDLGRRGEFDLVSSSRLTVLY
jgi:hypothetical protein